MEASPTAYRLQAHQFRATAKRTRTEGILRDLEALARLYAELADYVEARAAGNPCGG